VRAITPVSKGQEIFIAYHDLEMPRAGRQAFLTKDFGFTCLCAVCTRPASLSSTLEADLQLFNETWNLINSGEGVIPIELLRRQPRLSEICDRQGLLRLDIECILIDSLATLGMTVQLREYVRPLITKLKTYLGDAFEKQGYGAPGLERYLQELESHPNWMQSANGGP
jgi:hypothetical protein